MYTFNRPFYLKSFFKKVKKNIRYVKSIIHILSSHNNKSINLKKLNKTTIKIGHENLFLHLKWNEGEVD